MQQLLLELLPPPLPSFANFVAGGNAETFAALQGWLGGASATSAATSAATSPVTSQVTCLLLWGEAGCGRSHLLAASGAATFDAAGDPELASLPAEVEDAGLVAIDNVEALAPAGQVALFNAFNRLKAAGGRLLAAAALPPQQLVLREDLRTRLGSGLIYRLRVLTDDEKALALRERAERRGLRLSAEALDYLFRHARRDMGTLAALVDALDRFTLEHRRPVTLPLLRQLLASENPETLNE